MCAGMRLALRCRCRSMRTPPQGVHVHVSNPTMPQSPSHMADTRKGAGLPGLAKRIQQAGGTCQYGFDQHNVFHLDVRLPWVG